MIANVWVFNFFVNPSKVTLSFLDVVKLIFHICFRTLAKETKMTNTSAPAILPFYLFAIKNLFLMYNLYLKVQFYLNPCMFIVFSLIGCQNQSFSQTSSAVSITTSPCVFLPRKNLPLVSLAHSMFRYEHMKTLVLLILQRSQVSTYITLQY